MQALKVKFSKLLRSIEFAKQLHHLHETNIHSPNLVSKWLVEVLCDTDVQTATSAEFPHIVKKLRDEIHGKNLQHAFRRSAFYMCIKSLLQHSLTMELGADMGKLLYKVIMLQFITNMGSIFKASKSQSHDIGLMCQLVAKLARRIEKLNKWIDELDEDLSEEIDEMKVSSIHGAKATIKAIRTKIDAQIDKLQTDDEKKAHLSPLNDLNFKEDVIQKVPKLKAYLDQRNKATEEIAHEIYPTRPKYRRHVFEPLNAPPNNYFEEHNDNTDKQLRLMQFENWVLYELNLDVDTIDSESIRKHSFTYASVTGKMYENDPLGTSKMILVQLKLLAILDGIACRKYPLLNKHRTGINPAVINALLLPQRIDMQVADELEEYYKERNQSTGPSLIEENKITDASFSASFAAQNEEMQKLRKEILHETEVKIKQIEKKWIEDRKRVQNLRSKLVGLGHSKRMTWQNQYKCQDCTLCLIKKEIKKIKIQQYEKPLPEKEFEQNAVIFELRIPSEIGHLRDALYNFVVDCSGPLKERLGIKGNWIEAAQFSKYKKLSLRPSYQFNVLLGSTSFQKVGKIHVDKPLETFILSNEYNCTFHVSSAPMPKQMADNCIKAKCTLKVEAGTHFEGLQWMLNSTSHNENQVLASQSKCSDGISLTEYKNFGFLRADGHRLQLHKLYAMMATEALPFEEPSVLSLIMQSLWECEEKGNAGIIRESHDEFNHKNFALSMIKRLDQFVEQQKDNWMHPLKLLMAAFIVVRVMEINERNSVTNKSAELLDKVRNVTLDWIKKIQAAIRDLRNPDKSVEQSLRIKLALVAIAGAVTFSVHPSHKYHDKILQKNTHNNYSAFRIWLEFIITLHNNILLSDITHTDSILNMRMFLRLVLRIGVQLEPKMKELINNDVNEMFTIVQKQWNRADEKTFKNFYFDDVCPQQWCAESNKKAVKIDIVTGAFLVNNLPVARLPRHISDHMLYQRVFQSFTFEIQPENATTFTTVQKYNDRAYKFNENNGAIVITECCGDGVELELLPTTALDDELPYLLVNNYSHWWSRAENIIYCRPKSFDDKHFSTEDGIEYRFDLNKSCLLHLKTQQCLLDITSKSYSNIVKQLSRLESPNFINILLNPKIESTVSIELTRMNLKFTVDISKSTGNYDIVSNEFSQMRVSLEQKCGTLYGLNYGLLLESVCDSSSAAKLILMPHGQISIERTKEHVTVDIDTTSDLFNPPFHLYRIDTTCRQLKSTNNSYSAWLYLAYLHAVTSHGEIEPFTGISGTESALQILQSGYVWSSAPYDAESIDLLNHFAELSPKRKVGHIPQTVEWPDFIPAHSAQDSYVFIARKLLADSQRLHRMYFADEVSIDVATDLELNRREYLRHLQLAPNLRVSDAFIQRQTIHTILPTIPNITYSTNTRTISVLYHKRGYNIPVDWNLWTFFNGKKKILKGAIPAEDLGGILNHCKIDNFANLWISLYDAARRGSFNSEEFALIWSLFAHQNEPIEPILALQAIEHNKAIFGQINPPEYDEFDLSKGLYDKAAISAILKKEFAKYYHRNTEEVAEKIRMITTQIDEAWPIDQFYYNDDIYYSFYINDAINCKLEQWYINQKLKDFVDQVEAKLRTLVPSMSMVEIGKLQPYNTPKAKNWKNHEVNFDLKMKKIPTKFKSEIDEAKRVWKLEADSTKTSQEWWTIYESVLGTQIEKYFIDARMHPRAVPSLVLPKIASQDIESSLKMIIGALAITIAKENREKRINALKQHAELKATWEREIENEPYQNWKPCDYPEWLLFEIEQDLTIRRIQTEIAKRMISPPEGTTKHSTMQLNMGEGKTAVIVPILASVLANGNQACQVTVLKSLFATNSKAMRKYLGGLLNRRIYIFPCRRDMPINDYIDEIQQIYVECKQVKGNVNQLHPFEFVR